jgi:hypothetical protein
MAVYWRVKRWGVEWSATWAEVETGGGDFVLSDSGSMEFEQRRTIYEGGFYDGLPPEGETLNDETQLVCPPDELSFGAKYGRISIPPVGGQFVFDCLLQVYPGDRFAAVGADGKEYRSMLFFEGRTVRWSFRAAPFVGALGTYGTFTLSMLGKDYVAPIFAENSRSNEVGFANNLSVTIGLQAIEYWPYNPGDGDGPIYNAATGVRLRANPL